MRELSGQKASHLNRAGSGKNTKWPRFAGERMIGVFAFQEPAQNAVRDEDVGQLVGPRNMTLSSRNGPS
jgi:hypothetical protein